MMYTWFLNSFANFLHTFTHCYRLTILLVAKDTPGKKECVVTEEELFAMKDNLLFSMERNTPKIVVNKLRKVNVRIGGVLHEEIEISSPPPAEPICPPMVSFY
mmetsp:Transcript_12697/g.18098  ORF Transcript_12697/g.18098 Transcript_12697/m.18098 type:complete len:103 (+) Transcript_12697:306-614(+)